MRAQPSCKKASVFSLYRDKSWTPEQYRQLQPVIREELNTLVQHLLNSIENKGSVLPASVLGYYIVAYDKDEDGIYKEQPIRDEAFPDYGDMWWEYLHQRMNSNSSDC